MRMILVRYLAGGSEMGLNDSPLCYGAGRKRNIIITQSMNPSLRL
jgi:hypothetical protein